MSGEMRHIEMFTNDLDKAKEFYEGLFEWEFSMLRFGDAGFMRWKVCCGIGGVFRLRKEGSPDDFPGPVNYIGVDDIEATAERITANGGEIIFISPEIEKGGPRLGLFCDPDGNIMGLWQIIKKTCCGAK